MMVSVKSKRYQIKERLADKYRSNAVVGNIDQYLL